MRTLSALILAAASLGSPAVAQDAGKEPPRQITLDQALEIAFRESPDIRAALAQINKATGGISEANANFYPKFSGQVTHTRQGPTVSFTAPGLGSVDIVQEHNTTGAVSFMLPIDLCKQLGYVSDIARCQFQLDYLALLTASQQLILDVKTAFYDVLRAQGQQDVAQAAVDVATARLKDASARYSAGTAPKFDVTRAQVDVANFNQQLIRAKSRVSIARAALNRVMGVDVNAPTELASSEISIESVEVDVEKSIQEACAKRPEIKSAETAIDLSRRNVKLQRTGIFPTLTASANYNYNFRVAGFSAENASWIALINLTAPIWDGGVTKARVDQANADVARSIQNLESAKLGVGLGVKTAALVLQEATDRVATASENVALAEEALRLANVRYNGGISTMVEVTDAELALTQAKTDWVNARYDYVMGVAGLEKATGNQPELEKLQLLATGPATQR